MATTIMKPMGPIVLVIDLGSVTGPFFLGFMMEAFGMGVVLVLALDYLLSIASRRKLPSESPRRIGVILVSITLMLTSAQTIVDLYRGFRIFGTNFMSITAFLAPDPLWFWSPFLGIVSAVITQGFLLRRIVRFLSSLELLWPVLSRTYVKYTFTLSVSLAILLAAIAGFLASHTVAAAGGLASVSSGSADSSGFQVLSALWLGTAVAIDCILCLILCMELWWARRKLSMKGTTMQEFMSRLILVTFHGGAAVTGLQVATLLLYYYQRTSAWCYFPMILLPKVYSITLILSISLPEQTAAQAPSAMISLPTIQPDVSDLRNTPVPRAGSSLSHLSRRAQVGRYIHFTTDGYEDPANVADVKKFLEGPVGAAWTHSAPDSGKRWSEVFKGGWRRSQGLLSWSLMPGEGLMGGAAEEKFGKTSTSERETERDKSPTTRPVSAPQDRRPSLMPLLPSSPSPPSAQHLSPLVSSHLTRSSSFPTPFSARRDTFFPSSISTISTSRDRREWTPNHTPNKSPDSPASPIPYPQPIHASPPPNRASTYRQSSVSATAESPITRFHRRSTVPFVHDLHQAESSGSSRPYVLPLPLIHCGRDPPGLDFHFDTINPFGSVHSLGSQLSSALYPPGGEALTSQVPLYGLGGRVQDLTVLVDRAQRRSRIGDGIEDEVGDDDEEGPRGSSEIVDRGRNMSFQDFLAGKPDPEPDIGSRGKRKASGLASLR